MRRRAQLTLRCTRKGANRRDASSVAHRHRFNVWRLGGTLGTLVLPVAVVLGHALAQTSAYKGRDSTPVAATAPAEPFTWELPPGFPQPVVPEDNPMSHAKVELGRHLFYDTRLSGHQTQACASCHVQTRAFTDGRERSIGSTGEVGPRNVPSLANVVYMPTLNWANPTLTQLERHILVPMFGESPVELGLAGREEELLERLRADGRYQELFQAAYPELDDPFSVHTTVQALASFVRTIISGDSPYDRFVYGGEWDALSASAQRGLDLFLSERLECHHCHGGFNFAGGAVHENTTFVESAFHNTGLYNVDGRGRYPHPNTGLFEITGRPNDMGRFRAPSLRNVAVTAPYFHDGSAQTLEEVVRFYEAGGRVIDSGPHAGDGRANPFKSGLVMGFSLTDEERADLIAFLESLTDETLLTDPRLSNPWAEPAIR
jgi:cytochrome c peroxidase